MAINLRRKDVLAPDFPYPWPTVEAFEENVRRARRALVEARHASEDLAASAALTVRRHPFAAVGAAAAAGAIGGCLIGFAAWRLLKART